MMPAANRRWPRESFDGADTAPFSLPARRHPRLLARWPPAIRRASGRRRPAPCVRRIRRMADLKVEVEPAEAGFDAGRLGRIDSHFARYVDDGRLPGWLVVVSRGGRIV